MQPGAATVLPPPQTTGGMSLSEAMYRRRSRREFTRQTLTLEQVGQLCWAGQGITERGAGLRSAPSAGGLLPFAILVVQGQGLAQYDPGRHALQGLGSGDYRRQLQAAALDQPCVGTAPLCLVIAVDVPRTAAKYGGRAERYCLLEAGHIAQNILLQATALGLAGVPVGAFEERKLAKVLGLPANLQPLYLLPIGFALE